MEDGVATELGKGEDVPVITGAVGLNGMGEVEGAGLTGLPEVEGRSGAPPSISPGGSTSTSACIDVAPPGSPYNCDQQVQLQSQMQYIQAVFEHAAESIFNCIYCTHA